MTQYQATFDGRRIPVGSTTTDRVYCLMVADEGCRNYLMELLWTYWMEDGLRHLLYPEQHDVIGDWFTTKATNAKSLINRWQDHQRNSPHLAPSPDVAERRGRG